MIKREKDWLAQAEKDLKHSENSTKLGDFEWVCFSAQPRRNSADYFDEKVAMEAINAKVDVNIIVYTQKEFNKMLKEKNNFILKINEEKIL